MFHSPFETTDLWISYILYMYLVRFWSLWKTIKGCINFWMWNILPIVLLGLTSNILVSTMVVRNIVGMLTSPPLIVYTTTLAFWWLYWTAERQLTKAQDVQKRDLLRGLTNQFDSYPRSSHNIAHCCAVRCHYAVSFVLVLHNS